MAITASEVNKLRQMTGAGMMDCKKALEEANGDFDQAIDILRKKGQKVAAKRSDRDATEGVVIAKSNGSKGMVIVLNCETDFVAKNEGFVQVANNILDAALNSGVADIDQAKALPFPGSNITIGEKITEEVGKIGEKIDLSFLKLVEGGKVTAYNHPGNKLAAVVAFNKDLSDDMSKDVAMQIAAMDPVAVDKDSVSAEVIAKEIEIGKELAIQEGKPADMAEKIAQGRLSKFFKESTLLAQPFIKDNKLSVEQYLHQSDKELTVKTFVRFSLN
jgi:elongation factor Ts